MNYKFNDDTLIHGISFNPMKLEGILKYGIVSENYARNNNIPYSRNYNFTIDKYIKDSDSVGKLNTEENKDNIYLVRYLYISDDPFSAYNKYVKNGISVIIEDVPFIYDKGEVLIKRSDEVVVKDNINPRNITGIMVLEEYKDKLLNEVMMLPENILNYNLIKSSAIELVNYLQSNNYEVDITELSYLLKDLGIANKSVNSLSKDNIDYNDALNDYKDIINDINYFLSENVYNYFSSILGKSATVLDMVEFINNKYNKDIVIESMQGKTR